MSLPNPLRAVVIDQELRTTKQNKLYWQVMLRTKVGVVKSFMWGVPNDVQTNPNYPHVGDIIQLDAFKDQMAEYQNIVIDAWHNITKESVPKEDSAIFKVYKASDDEMREAFALLKDSSFWENSEHHRFVMACLGKLDLEKLKMSPAAVLIHHAYNGGLLVHSAEVLALCRAYVDVSFSRYGFINKDVLYAAAILHDIGKVKTYSFNAIGTTHQLITEKIIGHIPYGMFLVQTIAEEGKIQVEPEFVIELMHCIAAHHGTVAWGSIKEPQSLEAGIISRLDYISSRNGMMEKVLQENVQSGQPLQADFKIYGDQYFASSGIKRYVEEKGIDAAVNFKD